MIEELGDKVCNIASYATVFAMLDVFVERSIITKSDALGVLVQARRDVGGNVGDPDAVAAADLLGEICKRYVETNR